MCYYFVRIFHILFRYVTIFVMYHGGGNMKYIDRKQISDLPKLRGKCDRRDREVQIELERVLAELLAGKINNILFDYLIYCFEEDTNAINEIYYNHDKNIVMTMLNTNYCKVSMILKANKLIDENHVIENKHMSEVYLTEWVKIGEKYCFGFIGRKEKEDTIFEVEIVCEDVQINVELFNYMEFHELEETKPWSMLIAKLIDMKDKAEKLGDEYLNEIEKKLFPLATFLPLLLCIPETDISGEVKKEQIDILLKYARDSKNQSVENLLLKLHRGEDAFDVSDKISSILLKEKSQNLWRLIYNDMEKATVPYENRIERYCGKKEIEQVRNFIDDRFKKYGINGSYPDYYKENPEHKAITYVKCFEGYIRGRMCIKIKIITKRIKKNETNKYEDYFSAWFSDTKDVKEWGMDMYLDYQQPNCVEKEIKKYCNLIFKIIEKKKLEQAEKNLIYSNSEGINVKLISRTMGISIALGLLLGECFTGVFFLVIDVIPEILSMFFDNIRSMGITIGELGWMLLGSSIGFYLIVFVCLITIGMKKYLLQ